MITVLPSLLEAYWKKSNVYPFDYVTTFQNCQFKLNVKIVTIEVDDPDHPDFRLHKIDPSRFYKYLSGLKYSVPISLGSERRRRGVVAFFHQGRKEYYYNHYVQILFVK